MFKIYFLILFFGHILGDYYLQTKNIADEKNEKFNKLIFHCIIYGFIQFLIIGVLFHNSFVKVTLFIVLSHFVIDFFKHLLYKGARNTYDRLNRGYIYIVDQLLHIVCIGIGTYFLMDKSIELQFVLNIFEFINVEPCVFLNIVILFLLLHKPANVTIKELTKWYKPNTDNNAEGNKKTGAIIGTMERYIILLLLYLNQYSAVGLVLTAKSIARYHELEEKEFAEYYLIGTLLSTFIVIVAYLTIA